MRQVGPIHRRGAFRAHFCHRAEKRFFLLFQITFIQKLKNLEKIKARAKGRSTFIISSAARWPFRARAPLVFNAALALSSPPSFFPPHDVGALDVQRRRRSGSRAGARTRAVRAPVCALPDDWRRRRRAFARLCQPVLAHVHAAARADARPRARRRARALARRGCALPPAPGADTRALCARAPPFSLSLGLWHCRLLARGGQGH